MATTGRCMKCKGPSEMKDEVEVTMKNGMKAASGVCVKCGTKMFKILGKAKGGAAPAAPEPEVAE